MKSEGCETLIEGEEGDEGEGEGEQLHHDEAGVVLLAHYSHQIVIHNYSF